jgi:hypothetical protein
MANPQNYGRANDGIRFKPGGINTVKAVDQITQPGEYSYLQNVRGYLQNRLIGRTTQSSALDTLSAVPHTMRRLNDSTPSGPTSGYARIIGAAGLMYINSTKVASGLSGNPVSMVPFRPNASVQPWMYIGDSSTDVTITSSSFVCDGMLKIRSDGLTYKTGIAEPQVAPVVSTGSYTTNGTDVLPATAMPWTNRGGTNANWNFGGIETAANTNPVVINTPIEGSTVTLSVTGTATLINGVSNATPSTSSSSWVTSVYPGHYLKSGASSCSVVVAAFTDINGNVIAEASSSTTGYIYNVGAGVVLTVPVNAVQLHVGINSQGGTFHSNSGNFTLTWTVVTPATATVVSLYNTVTAYYWGDSPHSGSVSLYIWKNPEDSGSGTSRTSSTAAGSSTNNSLIFDSTPNTSSNPVLWTTLNTDGTVEGTIDLFATALESQGFQDFNVCIVGSLYIPVAGTYAFQMVNKDQVMFGIGGGATTSLGTVKGPSAQTETVISALPLMAVSSPNGEGGAVTTSFNVTFSEPGTYSCEADWDYWYHNGRTMVITCAPTPGAAVATIPPLSTNVRTNVSYEYVYRSSKTGAVSNPSPASTIQDTPVLANTVTSLYSSDPQVDKVDYYRMDATLTSYTYIATGPNDNLGVTSGYNTPIQDTVTDSAAEDNSTISTDNFEPFPSIDTPKSGVINISGGTITWVSGDTFNTSWLPGTIILIGSPTQLGYTLYSRPTSTTTMYLPDAPDGTNLNYNIAEPILAARPLPSMWGPTDNTAYMFACNDPYRPGTLYFTKGNNPDSAPDTNQIEVTSPSEPLMNGCIVNGVGMVFSTERAWIIDPTYTSALATVSGVQGSAFNLIESITNRGLYIRSCLCTEAGMNVFFRAKDGIYVSPKGSGSQSITDSQLYNLFPHEGSTPAAVTIASYTIYPPNDLLPNKQTLSFANGYLYYDYEDTSGNPRTLVYDVVAKGWIVDVYGTTVTCHALEEGVEVNDTLVGCTDSTVRDLESGGTETATSVVATGAVNTGDARAFKRLGDVFLKAFVATSNPVTVSLYTDRYQTALTGFSPTSLTGNGTIQPYIIDFTSGYAKDVIDVEAVLSWPTNSTTYIDLWQPTFIALPEATQDRPTDWGDLGSVGLNFVQGLILEADTFNAAKAISVEDELGNLHVPNESPFTLNGQQKIPLTFTPPFTSHIGRVVSTDGVRWKLWGINWVSLPYPESTVEWQTEMLSHGMKGWFHVRMMNLPMISTTAVTLTLVFDAWPTITLAVPSTSGSFIKQKVQIPANKTKLLSYRLSSTAPFYLFKNDVEVWIGQWGRTEAYTVLKPFGGSAGNAGAQV